MPYNLAQPQAGWESSPKIPQQKVCLASSRYTNIWKLGNPTEISWFALHEQMSAALWVDLIPKGLSKIYNPHLILDFSVFGEK